MAYRVRAEETVPDGIRRIATEQVERALREISDEGIDRREVTHRVRRRCKRVRALVHLAEAAFVDPHVGDVEDAWFRDAAHGLAGARDAQVMVETYEALMAVIDQAADRRRFGPVRRRLAVVSRRQATQDLRARLAAFAGAMREVRERIGAWRLERDGFAILAPGFTRTYRRGRVAFEKAYDDPTPEAFHEWRRHAKYHLHQVELLLPVSRSRLERRAVRLGRLAEHLGEEHDLTVLRSALTDTPSAFGGTGLVTALVDVIDGRRVDLQRLARPLGARLYRERPKVLAAGVSKRWRAWSTRSARRGRSKRRKG